MLESPSTLYITAWQDSFGKETNKRPKGLDAYLSTIDRQQKVTRIAQVTLNTSIQQCNTTFSQIKIQKLWTMGSEFHTWNSSRRLVIQVSLSFEISLRQCLFFCGTRNGQRNRTMKARLKSLYIVRMSDCFISPTNTVKKNQLNLWTSYLANLFFNGEMVTNNENMWFSSNIFIITTASERLVLTPSEI